MWFSAKIRLVSLTEKKGAISYLDSIHIFKSKDFASAFKRALEMGKSLEDEYINAREESLCWKLKEIVSLDIIGKNILDSTEVYSEFIEVPKSEKIEFHAKLSPEKSEPTQTI